MIFPIRCFTCGKLLADKYEEYERRMQEKFAQHPVQGQPLNVTTEKSFSDTILTELKVTRDCCRRMFLGHVEMFEKM